MSDLGAEWDNRKTLRALVCGGRDYDDRGVFYNTLSAIGPTFIIHGGAKGADAMADEWAFVQGVSCVTFPANWDAGKSAGPIRNQRMIDEGRPDIVIAFPGGRGTADMVRRARKAGIEVREIG